ncbi:MAG: helix-turn-helix transcriptional regulator [Verrucomicrobia bacterium]|nr:helix-turn-helix transcriptional regulator [Verrucomicrobiota bacterium]
MSTRNTDLRPADAQLGNLLRHWRNVRGRNQLDLSIETGISQRHISFIESGRSKPSRQTLLEIAQVLDVPLRERNSLLLSAGFAPVYSETAWNSAQMHSVTKALERILRQHEPFPALVMDRYWNVLMTNESVPRFFNCFFDMSQRKGPRNMLHLVFDPDGMRPFVERWDEVAASLIHRVRTEATGRVIDDKTRELLAALHAYSDVKTGSGPGGDQMTEKHPQPRGEDRRAIGAVPTLPMIPISFRKSDTVLNYFSLVTTVGTPQTVAAQELRIESMFPADEETEQAHLKLLGMMSA